MTLSRLTATLASRLECATSSKYLIFPFFIILNLFTYADRGIIPGASREFSSFAANAQDTTEFIQNHPDAGIGLLQAGFILGYSVAIVICGHLVHSVQWKKMTMIGFFLWLVAVFFSALSYSFDSFFVLFFARTLSGVSEASFQVIAPPMFQDRGGKHAGLWLSIFLSAMPLGMALGYVLGSLMANHSNYGWPWAYWIEGFLALPVLMIGFFIRDEKNGGVFTPKKEVIKTNQNDSSKATESTITSSNLTFMEEIKICLSSKPLLAIIAAQSICIAVFAVLSTFGGAFLLALNLFESETQGATLFGITAAIGGVIGTPLGGVLTDKVLSQHEKNINESNETPTEYEYHTSMRIKNLRELITLLPVTTGIVSIGIAICYPTLFISNAYLFLGFLFFGWIFLFAAQSGITISVMLSVPDAQRSNAIAFTTLMVHVFGDVPSPIIFGLLKDEFAPACVVTADGLFLDEVQCRIQHIGIRLTIGLAYVWITASVFFFEWARRLAMAELENLENGIETGIMRQIKSTFRVPVSSLFPVKSMQLDKDHDNDNKNVFEYDSEEDDVIDRSHYSGFL